MNTDGGPISAIIVGIPIPALKHQSTMAVEWRRRYLKISNPQKICRVRSGWRSGRSSKRQQSLQNSSLATVYAAVAASTSN
jgi:hypothetical protein